MIIYMIKSIPIILIKCKVLWFYVLLFNTTNFHTDVWFKIFQAIIWFQVTNNNNNPF